MPNPNSDDDLLKHLSLPALESLSLGLVQRSAFLPAATPPLKELGVGNGLYADSIRLGDLVPSLIPLRLWWPETANLFAGSPSMLLNLQCLSIHGSDSLAGSAWGMFLRGSIFSAIGRGINAVVSAIAGVIMAIVGAITTVIVTIFDVIVDILCCRCGSRSAGSRRSRRSGRRSGGI
ncbi:hypothetical protein C8R47DRAFT_1206038 [Mycena vitilis]|nr:hypothetical protein C8R47DRAFT_1206038 [Mycena vitilis]